MAAHIGTIPKLDSEATQVAFLNVVAATGSVVEASKAIGLQRTRVYEYFRRNPEFKERVDAARRECFEEASARTAALAGKHIENILARGTFRHKVDENGRLVRKRNFSVNELIQLRNSAVGKTTQGDVNVSVDARQVHVALPDADEGRDVIRQMAEAVRTRRES